MRAAWLVVALTASAALAGRATKGDVNVLVLGLNDFHGQISAGKKRDGRAAGSAGVVASWLRTTAAEHDGPAIIALAGDCVGASPAASGLLQDEPTVALLNLLANAHCKVAKDAEPDPRCNVVATLGNHEFDEGAAELLRLWRGGNHAGGPYLDARWRGARFPVVCSNVVTDAGKPLMPGSVVLTARGIRIGFVGAVVKSTPSLVLPESAKGLRFLDEADAINAEVARLRRRGVRAFVVLLHEGGKQHEYGGWTKDDAPEVTGRIRSIVKRLAKDVDLVVSGHTHQFTNARLPRDAGGDVLVTQAWSAGVAFAEIELTLSRATKDVRAARARIVTTWADEGPGLAPAKDAAALQRRAEEAVAPRVEKVVATLAGPVTRAPNEAGESALGDLVADAQRAATGADVAFMNPGGLRTDLAAGETTWGELFAVQPFGNVLTTMTLSGAQILAVLERQVARSEPLLLQVSGLEWTWDGSAKSGSRVVRARIGGKPIDPSRDYRVTVNSFLVGGGDGFDEFSEGRDATGGPMDVDALEAWLRAAAQPVTPPPMGRIHRAESR